MRPLRHHALPGVSQRRAADPGNGRGPGHRGPRDPRNPPAADEPSLHRPLRRRQRMGHHGSEQPANGPTSQDLQRGGSVPPVPRSRSRGTSASATCRTGTRRHVYTLQCRASGVALRQARPRCGSHRADDRGRSDGMDGIRSRGGGERGDAQVDHAGRGPLADRPRQLVLDLAQGPQCLVQERVALRAPLPRGVRRVARPGNDGALQPVLAGGRACAMPTSPCAASAGTAAPARRGPTTSLGPMRPRTASSSIWAGPRWPTTTPAGVRPGGRDGGLSPVLKPRWAGRCRSNCGA